MNDEEHKIYHRRIIYILIILFIFLFGGATFYHYTEEWRYIDSLYFSAATMTTVGYGDITPKTDVGKIFTIIYAFSGVSIALYGLSVIAAHFVEVRVEFWLERVGKLKIRQHTGTLFGKLKNSATYKDKEIIEGYDKSYKKKR